MSQNEIEMKIDEAFISTFVIPREKAIIDFLTDFFNSNYKFREDNKEIKIVSFFYNPASPLEFLFLEPSYNYYDPNQTIDRPELELEVYSYTDVHELCIKILDENNIDYSEHLNSFGDLDPANYWENQFKLESACLKHCWKKAKEKTGSKILGILESADFAGGAIDLDTNHYMSDVEDELDEYLKSKGYFLEKEI
jgi:hypothetical protein